jgi:hypothetical protein
LRGPDVFISYSREDVGSARCFAEAFTQAGLDVWWDAALRSGENFDEVIEKALRAAKAVVVLWSPRSVASRWVRAEATLADRMGTLAPVIIEPCERPIIFELTHTANLCHWTGDISDATWQIFVEDVRRFVDGERPIDCAPVPAVADAANGGSRPASGQSFSNRAGGGIGDFLLSNGKVESLISALSSLQAAMAKPKHTEPADVEEFEQTQFFTRSDEIEMFGGSELHCLELSLGEDLEKRFIVSPLGLKIGRTAPADVILADAKVSRSHCKVELKDNELYVLDLNSTNGTYVDGERVSGTAMLPLGSALKIGNFTLVHELRMRSDV